MTSKTGRPPLSEDSPTERRSVSAPEDIWDVVRDRADLYGVTVSQVVRGILERWARRQK